MNPQYLRLCLLLTLLCAIVSTHAQRSYRFEAATSTYTTLENDTKLHWNDFNAADLYNITGLDGETFWFYNIAFPLGGVKTFAIQSNGNLRIDNDSTLVIADGVFTYLDSINTTSSVSYLIEGNAGNKVLKAQWKNLKIRVGDANNYVNFQIWVYQQTGIVEVHYGASSPNNQSGFNTSSGPQVGMFFSEDDFTKCYEKLWVNGAPSSYTLDSANNYVFKAMSGVPVEGVVFRFIPRFTTTGTDDIELKDEGRILLYPNPVKGVINLEKAGDYYITDYTGRIIKELKGQRSLEVSDLPPGIYFLYSEESKATKFIVE